MCFVRIVVTRLWRKSFERLGIIRRQEHWCTSKQVYQGNLTDVFVLAKSQGPAPCLNLSQHTRFDDLRNYDLLGLPHNEDVSLYEFTIFTTHSLSFTQRVTN